MTQEFFRAGLGRSVTVLTADAAPRPVVEPASLQKKTRTNVAINLQSSGCKAFRKKPASSARLAAPFKALPRHIPLP